MSEAQPDLRAEGDEIRFAAEAAPVPQAARGAAAVAGWKLLVVDDEADVHHVTRLVLGRYRFDGRPVCLLGAWSAAEARVVLASHPDVAVILLDVVMETDDAACNWCGTCVRSSATSRCASSSAPGNPARLRSTTWWPAMTSTTTGPRPN